MRMVVGLGNPGDEYVGTRHNVGFDCVELLAERMRVSFRSRGGEAEVADGRSADPPFVLLKPMTYMNRSGEPVRKALRDFGGEKADLLVVVDDFALDLGRLRVRASGSDGGHNGLKSLIQSLGGQDFARLRIGIGQPPPRMPAEVYVLQRFRPVERKDVRESVEVAAEAAEEWIRGADVQSLMNRYNGR